MFFYQRFDKAVYIPILPERGRHYTKSQKSKKDKKENYRPVSILPVLSKIFERIMFKQMPAFFEDIFNKQQCGLCKGYNTQQCLLKMLEKWKRSVDGGNAFGALLTDLYKAFDCLDHELLIAKLHAYGFSLPTLRLINDYLSDRKQRTRIGNSFSDWCEIILRVPQGSILRPLLFNIFLADLFLALKDVDIANFADDNTPYTSANNVDELIDSLEKASSNLFKWFKDNLFKGNPDKCHLLVSTNEKIKNIGDFSIENSDCEKLLGVKIDNKLTFDYHVSDMCKKANRKINALARIEPFININKKRILMNSFFRSQFNYFPIIWMCHNRTNNRKINRLHQRCLRIIYNDKQSSFIELLEKDNSVSIHQRNLQVLAIEMFKVSNGLSRVLMKDIFKRRGEQTYNLRKHFQFYRPKVNSV